MFWLAYGGRINEGKEERKKDVGLWRGRALLIGLPVGAV